MTLAGHTAAAVPEHGLIKTPVGYLPSLLSVSDAAAAAGVSRRTIYNWMRAEQIEVVYSPSGLPRIVTLSLWRTER